MPAGVPLTISDAADTVDLSIQRMWVKRASSEIEQRTKIANVQSTTDYYEKDSSLSDLGLAARITENASVVAESPVQGFDRTYTQVEYGKLLAVTKKMWFFGIKKRKLEGIVDELKRACIRKKERFITNKLVNAQSTSYSETDDNGNFTVTVTGGNSVALASSSQTREDGGTNNNNIVYNGANYNVAAGYNGLKALWRTAARVLSPKGNQMAISPTRVFTGRGTTAYFRFKEVLGAIKAGKLPETFSNDGAGVPEFELVALPYWSDDNAWAACDPNMINDQFGIQLFESQPVQLEGPNIVFKTGELQLSLAEVKPSLINGENPEAGNAQQAGESRAVATTKREGLFKRVSNSLNTAYNAMKAVNWAEMSQSTL